MLSKFSDFTILNLFSTLPKHSPNQLFWSNLLVALLRLPWPYFPQFPNISPKLILKNFLKKTLADFNAYPTILIFLNKFLRSYHHFSLIFLCIFFTLFFIVFTLFLFSFLLSHLIAAFYLIFICFFLFDFLSSTLLLYF